MFARSLKERWMGGVSFWGNYQHTLDAKNRLFIPAKFREGLGDSFVLYSPKNDNCLYAYNVAEWESICAEVIESGNLDMQRYIFDDAISVEPDKQGRITIKADFCKRVGLKKEIVVAGVGKRVEIWDAQKREAAMQRAVARADTYPEIHF